MSTKMQVETVRNVFVELRSIGPSFSGGICSVPLGKIEKLHVEDRQHVRGDVGDDHVGDEDAEGQGGQRQVEAAQAEAGQGDEATDDGRHRPRRGAAPTA